MTSHIAGRDGGRPAVAQVRWRHVTVGSSRCSSRSTAPKSLCKPEIDWHLQISPGGIAIAYYFGRDLSSRQWRRLGTYPKSYQQAKPQTPGIAEPCYGDLRVKSGAAGSPTISRQNRDEPRLLLRLWNPARSTVVAELAPRARGSFQRRASYLAFSGSIIAVADRYPSHTPASSPPNASAEMAVGPGCCAKGALRVTGTPPRTPACCAQWRPAVRPRAGASSGFATDVRY